LTLQQQQFFNLCLLLLLGALFSNLYLLWYEIFGIFIFTLLFDNVLLKRRDTKKIEFRYSSLSTSIGVMLMMATSHYIIYLIVISLALLQKYYLQINREHFFNPSNFALMMALLFFYDDAHLILGQLGDALWLALLLIVMAVVILIRANRWIIPLVFTFCYLIFQYLFVISLDPLLIMDEIYYRFYSVSFILFILFMLTDPKTTPQSNFWQMIFAFMVALFSVGLDYLNGFRVQHLFFSLFLFSLFTPLVKRYQHQSKRLIIGTVLLLTMAIVVILIIESRPPFYFTMDN